jgi:hypothetical protein
LLRNAAIGFLLELDRGAGPFGSAAVRSDNEALLSPSGQLEAKGQNQTNRKNKLGAKNLNNPP